MKNLIEKIKKIIEVIKAYLKKHKEVALLIATLLISIIGAYTADVLASAEHAIASKYALMVGVVFLGATLNKIIRLWITTISDDKEPVTITAYRLLGIYIASAAVLLF